MKPGDAACATQATPNLYMVTIKNLDGTTKTVLKSQPLQGAVSCYELTPDQINALWFAGQADLPGNRGPIPAVIRRNIALFVEHHPTDPDPNSKKLVELDNEEKEQARRVALAIATPSLFEVPSQTSSFAIPDHVLDAALNGDAAVVHRMLRTHAHYLLYRGTASDFSDRKYDNLTPFQAALITGDIEMAEMMKPFFARLANGEAEMQKQVVEIFPHGIEEHEKEQKKELITKFVPMLDELIAVIKNATNENLEDELNINRRCALSEFAPEDIETLRSIITTSITIFPKELKEIFQQDQWDSNYKSITFTPQQVNELKAFLDKENQENLSAKLLIKCNKSELDSALNKFRAAFTDLSHSEKIFNPHYLLAAFEAYLDKFDWSNRDWNNPYWNKLDLFWRQVIGFVQRFLPATYAQAFAHSLYDIVEDKHSRPRSFNFKYDSDFPFYPLTDSFTGLGFSRAAAPGGLLEASLNGVSASGAQVFFKTYVEQKQQAFRTYYATSAISRMP